MSSLFYVRLFLQAESQAAAKQTFGECREGQIPRTLGRFKFDALLLAAGFLTLAAGSMDKTNVRKGGIMELLQELELLQVKKRAWLSQ